MSNSNIRVVKYNEDIFKVPSKTQKRKKPDNPIKIKSASNKSIRNNVLKEIRKHQEQKYNELLEDKTKVTNLADKFEDDFKDSIEFMEKIAKKHKETKLNETIKNHNASVENSFRVTNDTNLIPVNIDEPGENMMVPMQDYPQSFSQPSMQPFQPKPIIAPTPTFGCLKNGSLPTYRSYHNKTVKAHEPSAHQAAQALAPQALAPQALAPQAIAPQQVVAERIKSPTELLLIEKMKQKEIEEKSKNLVKKQKKYKKLLRRTYRVGRDKYRPKVGVLLPNKTIRTNVTTKSYLLKQTPIDEIRKTLIKKGFIKAGSSAPNDVLRKIYESIQLIDGDVNNHNPDYLLHNFFSENK
jgi:hypothetical protein